MADVRPLIDYRTALVSGQGIGRYTRELVRALCAADGVSPALFAPTWKGADVDRKGLGIESARLFRKRIPSKFLTAALRTLRMDVARLVGGADVVHHTQYRRLPTRRPEVATVHDLVFLDSERYVSAHASEHMSAFVRDVARTSTYLLTLTETVADEVSERLDVPRDRVVAVPLGADHVRRIQVQPADRDAVARSVQQSGPFFFTAARIETRKNLVPMLRAFEGMDEPRLRWLVAGTRGDGAEAFLDALRVSPVRDRVELLGHITESQLRAHIEGALAFVLVPHDEGFGLAPLEAMTLGTPAITSDVPVVREVCAGGAALVDPIDVEGLRCCLEELAGSAAAREAAAERGLRHAADWNWARTAKETSAVYRAASEAF